MRQKNSTTAVNKPRQKCKQSKNKQTNKHAAHILRDMLPVTVARFSSDGSAIRYVLPVSWMTSYVFI